MPKELTSLKHIHSFHIGRRHYSGIELASLCGSTVLVRDSKVRNETLAFKQQNHINVQSNVKGEIKVQILQRMEEISTKEVC